jgi:hypothetical protein
MKTVAIWTVISAVAFIAMGFQMGIFRHERAASDDEAAVEEEQPARVAKPGTKFPDDLAPAAFANPVPTAAPYKYGNDPHPMVVLAMNGVLHPWHEYVREDWAAESVATTQLVVVLGNPKKSFVSHHTYAGGAPPITRWLFELEVSVIEAKTGRILANRLFRNEPRPLMRVEAWETTAIGKAVSFQQVFHWVSRTSKVGFPENHVASPIVTVVE